MGVRHADKVFRRQLDEVIERRASEIRSILQRYGVPLAERGAGEYTP
jgi:hypothetical protein